MNTSATINSILLTFFFIGVELIYCILLVLGV